LAPGAQSLPRLRFYGILLALMIMTTREQPIQKLATRDGSFTAGRQATLFLAGTLTLATLFVVLVMGSLTEPDFWRLVRLVDVAAELIMFVTVSLLILAPIGFSRHLVLASVDAVVALMAQNDGQSLLPRLAAVFAALDLAIERGRPGRTSLAAVIRSVLQALLSSMHQRLSPQRPKSKAPILLFQQAPLLIAP
jgi:hypothetical protein